LCTSDWRKVYGEERQRPGYVIENGKSQIKMSKEQWIRFAIDLPLPYEKRIKESARRRRRIR
jgi:hypothetical protein